MVAHAFNPSTQEAEAEGFLRSRISVAQDIQGYTEKPCLEKQKNKAKQNNQTKIKFLKLQWLTSVIEISQEYSETISKSKNPKLHSTKLYYCICICLGTHFIDQADLKPQTRTSLTRSTSLCIQSKVLTQKATLVESELAL